MQIPHDLQKYPSPTLIIASDSISAKFFLAGGDSLGALDGVALPREQKQDNEGSFVSADGSRVAGPGDETDDTDRLHAFIHQLNERTVAYALAHKIAHIDYAMPSEVAHIFEDHLPQNARPMLRKRLHADLMNESDVTLITRILNA